MGRKVNPYASGWASSRIGELTWYADKREYAELLLEDYEDPRADREGIRTPASPQSNRALPATDVRSRFGLRARDRHRPQGRHRERAARRSWRSSPASTFTWTSRRSSEPDLEAYWWPEHRRADGAAHQLPTGGRQAVQRRERAGAQGAMVHLWRAACRRGDGAQRDDARRPHPAQYASCADIDYGQAEALYDLRPDGVKVWIYKGEVLPKCGRRAAP